MSGIWALHVSPQQVVLYRRQSTRSPTPPTYFNTRLTSDVNIKRVLCFRSISNGCCVPGQMKFLVLPLYNVPKHAQNGEAKFVPKGEKKKDKGKPRETGNNADLRSARNVSTNSTSSRYAPGTCFRLDLFT